MNTFSHIFCTSLGWIGILYSEKGINRLNFPAGSEKEARQALAGQANPEKRPGEPVCDIVARLIWYLEGNEVLFPDSLDLIRYTEFQRMVWQITRSIPFGETRSYSWIAGKIGSPTAVRAVGNALGTNPIPIIIPCHRVISKKGGMAGYSGGLDLKKALLRLELSVKRLTG